MAIFRRGDERAYDVCDVVRYFKLAICSGSLCVDNSFGYAFAIEMRKEVNEVKVLEKKGSVGTDSIRRFWIEDRTAVGSCVYRSHDLSGSFKPLE